MGSIDSIHPRKKEKIMAEKKIKNSGGSFVVPGEKDLKEIDLLLKSETKSLHSKRKARSIKKLLNKLNIFSLPLGLIPPPDGDKKKRHKFFSGSFDSPARAGSLRMTRGVTFSYKIFLLAFALLILTFFIGWGIIKVNAEVNILSADTKEHLNNALDDINSGNTSNAMTQADLAKTDITKLKLLLQSWGQDESYLSLVSSNRSKLLTDERLLDATYIICNTLSQVKQDLSRLALQKSEVTTDSDKTTSINFDLGASQKILLSAIQNGQKNLVDSKKLLLLAQNGATSETSDQIDKALSAINKTNTSLDFSHDLIENNLPWLSGADGKDKNILILFQNNAELRGGSGGSLGSFGILHLSGGKLSGVDFGKNIYTLDHAYQATHQTPVQDELKWLGVTNLAMKDSGWAVDGPEAMQKISWFYKEETGQSVDGVIMLDTSAFVSLLREIGPIDMPTYNQTISADNFEQFAEYQVHEGYFQSAENLVENEPKKILSDMMPKFLNLLFSNLSDQEKAPAILESFDKSLKNKDITFYFDKSDFQQKINNLNYGGSVLPAIGDYIYVNDSNLAGGKSSSSVWQNISVNATIDTNGKINNSLALTRSHKGTDAWPDGINKNFVRLLVLSDSKINSFNPINGFFEQFFDQGYKNDQKYWLTSEAGKEVVNFWMSTKPGEQSQLSIDYSPQYSVKTNGDFTYIFTAQKQPGANPDQLNLNINYPQGFTPLNVKNFDSANRKINLSFTLNQDKTIKIKFKKN